ncbi:Transcriptional regulatory protein BtsR [BD1-7 clade bacterium]|uniref:Transcriptional regulatory protein BtsR n=1 Tax=BD1-7 clade bacterium TaxID=2029982 RepID=A0A5S9QDS5_9GAMM|nr:Transcriptional regulatory protein BtsR [BD1-7 clade bacterium]
MTDAPSNNIRVLIVDDESLARQRLMKMVGDIDGYSCVGEAKNGLEALEQFRSLEPDVILLDVRMPGMDGMEAARNIAEEDPGDHTSIIFTTAYDEYAIDAFDVQASGYLLKPVNAEKLEKALSQASKSYVKEHGAGDPTRQHLSAHSRGNVSLIPLKDVRVLQAEHKYVTVYYTDGESILDESLKALETEFPEQFTRVHRNALVSLKHVNALEKNAQGQYQLSIEGVEVKPVVSRRLVTQIRQRLKQL